MFKNLSSDKERLISNFFSLTSVEVANYIFPLLTLPYLVRVLGPEKYGLIAFAQAFVQYFVLFTDYGFNLSATRSISIYRNDREKVSKIFSSVLVIKAAMMVISFITMTALVFFVPKFMTDWLLYFFASGMVLGSVLFPIWFFQGMERMKIIPFLNLVAKFVFVVAIFVFVKAQADYIYVPLFTSLGFVTAGALSLWVAFRRFDIKFVFPSQTDVRHELQEGWHIFISTAATTLYTTSNTFVLGLLTNNVAVGYYSAAERLIRAGQRLLNPISQAIYPYMSKLVSDSKEKAIIFVRKALVLMGGGSFAISVVLLLLARPIVYFILGPQFQESVPVLRMLAFLPFIIALSNIFGIQTMITFNMKEAFSKILVSAGFINIILALILVPLFQHVGTAASVLITETYVTAAMFVFLLRKEILRVKV